MKIILVLVLLVLAPFAWASGVFEVTEQTMLSDLVMVQNEIDAISSAVMGCIDSGRTHEDCMCENKELFIHFTGTVNKLFAKYADLKNHDLVTFKDPQGVQVTQSMEGIEKQANMHLSCND